MKRMVKRTIAAGAIALPAVFAVSGVASAGGWGDSGCNCDYGHHSYSNWDHNAYNYHSTTDSHDVNVSDNVNASNNGNYDGNTVGNSLLSLLNGSLDGTTVAVPVSVLSG
jgi:hypothetical protein